jgi:hypothetical protein
MAGAQPSHHSTLNAIAGGKRRHRLRALWKGPRDGAALAARAFGYSSSPAAIERSQIGGVRSALIEQLFARAGASAAELVLSSAFGHPRGGYRSHRS